VAGVLGGDGDTVKSEHLRRLGVVFGQAPNGVIPESKENDDKGGMPYAAAPGAPIGRRGTSLSLEASPAPRGSATLVADRERAQMLSGIF
jgi:hypothetical protein